jgi:hypothetical protein
MARPATKLPTTIEVYERLDRPPWHAVSSHELANLLGVSIQWVWNWTMRETGPEPEPGNIYVRASNRRFFLPANALSWLSAREGNPTTPLAWCGRWLVERGIRDAESVEADPDNLRRFILCVERFGKWRRMWKVKLEPYLERLDAVLTPVLDPAE